MDVKFESIFQLVVETLPNAIVVVNKKGKIILVNKQTEVLFDYTRSELIGNSVDCLIPQRFRKSHPKMRNDFSKNPKTRPMGAGRDLYAVKKNDDEFPIEIGLNPIKIDNEIAILATITDITERKKLEQQIIDDTKIIGEKNKHLEMLTYVTSHDLRAPLQSISSFIELIEEQKGKMNLEGQESIKSIKSSVKRMNDLISAILNFGKIGKTSKLEQTDLSKLIMEVKDDLQFQINKSKADIKIGALPKLLVFKTEIRLLFQNVLSNAIKFSKKNISPKIIVSAKEARNEWLFCVEDNGKGIAKEALENIFILFQRTVDSKDIEGTGIGLAHCKKIAELHNGNIWVESEINRGSKFNFTINKNL